MHGRFQLRIFLAIAFGLAVLLRPAPVAAASSVSGEDGEVCDGDCQAVIKDWVETDVGRYMPGSLLPPERFEFTGAQQTCSTQRDQAPAVHAVVLAPFYRNFVKLPGTQNDAKLLRSFFADRGVKPEFMTIAEGDQVTREKMIAVLGDALRCVRERDQVAVVFTGGSASYGRWIAPEATEFAELICGAAQPTKEQKDFCDGLEDVSEGKWEQAAETFDRAVDDNDELVLFSSEVNIDLGTLRTSPDTLITGLGATELANFVTQVRNRGADAFVLLDTNYAAATGLLQLQRDAVVDGGWYWDTGDADQPAEADVNDDLVPLFGSGHFAAFYATNEKELARETAMGDDKLILGQFIFTFAEVLRQQPDIALTKLAEFVNRGVIENEIDQTPVFEASSDSLQFLTPGPEAVRGGNDIEIISPSPKRGAVAVEEKTLTVVARYSGTGRAYKAIVDGEIVAVDGNGQFRREVGDAGSKLVIPIRVLAPDFSTLASVELKLRDAEDKPAVAASARKLALIIANQNYGDAAFPTLRTPFADADAVAAILTAKYGFSTRLESADKPLDLFIKDASKAQIQQVLFELRRRLTAEDQLLLYYAGHGESDPDLGAFWIPTDGQPKADFTWVAAEEITRELKRMNASAILVVSDSCYAGGLSRGGGQAEAPDSAARERYLAKASRLKSRQLMSSGGDEPVEDGGGGGHSVFAKALIEALQAMPERTFTASELFEQKVKPAVISAANALTEGQTPGFSRISRAGDEPGSEFIFQSAATAP